MASFRWLRGNHLIFVRASASPPRAASINGADSAAAALTIESALARIASETFSESFEDRQRVAPATSTAATATLRLRNRGRQPRTSQPPSLPCESSFSLLCPSGIVIFRRAHTRRLPWAPLPQDCDICYGRANTRATTSFVGTTT